MDRETMVNRRRELQQEMAKGQQMLAQHTAAVESTKATLLRIDGAITVLDELLAAPKAEAAAE